MIWLWSWWLNHVIEYTALAFFIDCIFCGTIGVASFVFALILVRSWKNYEE